MSDINDLIQHALNQDYNKANEVFGDLMGQKMTDALEQEKINIASRIYGDFDDDLDTEEDVDIDTENEDEDLDDIDINDIDIEEE